MSEPSQMKRSMRCLARWIDRFGVLVVGAAIVLAALVIGLLATTVVATVVCVGVETVGAIVLVLGLHTAIEWKDAA